MDNKLIVSNKIKKDKNSKKLPWNFVLLTFLSVAAVLVFIFYILNLQYGIFSGINYYPTEYSKPVVHHYQDENINLEKILVQVFLFQPNDSNVALVKDWQSELETIFKKIKITHQEYFFNLSDLEYIIYPEIVQGEFSREYYDKKPLEFNPGGDEEQLNLIMDEINSRIQNKNLNKIDFDQQKYTYLVNQVFYTGSNKSNINIGIPVGYTNEARNKNSALIFWQILKSLNDNNKITTIVYHEFLHTLGVPEGYSYENGNPVIDDIMGAGIYRPIEINYLLQETKKKMGL